MDKITKDMFEHVGVNEEVSDAVVRPSLTYWQDAFYRFRKNRIALISVAFVLLMVVMSVVGPLLLPFKFNETDLSNIYLLPNSEHWFGTDELGRDLWVRLWRGTRVSFIIGLVVATIAAVVGVIIGGIAGYYGGKIDMAIMRFIDIFGAIPGLIITLLIIVVMGSGLMPIIIALIISGWLGMARLVRGQILQLKEQEYVLAARTLGADSKRILLRHLIPNTLGVIIVSITMSIPGAIFSEAFLSFIGLGVPPPESSWGQLASRGVATVQVHPEQLMIPAIFICLTMLAFNLFGDGLRDALDPRMKR